VAAQLRLAAKLLLQALPMALLLFLLFPRLPTPFGGLMHADTGRSGLSDSMRPGSFSELIESDDIAFRAEFRGQAPKPADLYWRGPVLWDYDGQTWRPATTLSATSIHSQAAGQPVEYAVTLEPHQQRWLFTLGLAMRAPDVPSDLTPDLQWLAKEKIEQRLRYSHAAYLDYHMDLDLAPESRSAGLQLPAGFNPRTRALINTWQSQGLAGAAIIERALSYFREEPFYYTLRPPRLGMNSVDEFLFDSQRGFCEHYAGAFVAMMRVAGLPARVVTGYLGGELNPMGRYWIVRQRDAHAWAEIWLPGSGWLRVDPTAAVAPERVERGLAAALPSAERPRAAWDLAALRPLRQAWDLVNSSWNKWVLGYEIGRAHV
jgi:transglutaminase-like putative cysteine protease